MKTMIQDFKTKIHGVVSGAIQCIPCICGKNFRFAFLLLSVLGFGSMSCNEMARDMGLEQLSDIDQRAGITGTSDNPGVLDPFKKYNLVMAANECRFLTIKVPHNWFWKVYVTAANRDESRRGQLKAEIVQSNPAWGQLPGAYFDKFFDLNREGIQAALGVGNKDETRFALLKLCQQGAPINITLESQISATTDLMGPDKRALKNPENQ